MKPVNSRANFVEEGIRKPKPIAKLAETESFIRNQLSKEGSFKSSITNLDPYATEIWQMVANPKVDQTEIASPTTPSEVLAKPKPSYKKKLGVIVHTSRVEADARLPQKFMSVEAFSNLAASASANLKLPPVSPQKQAAVKIPLHEIQTLEKESQSELRTELQKQLSSIDKRQYQIFSRKSSMPQKGRSSEVGMETETYKPAFAASSARFSRGVGGLTSPRAKDSIGVDGSEFYCPIKPNIREFNSIESASGFKRLEDATRSGIFTLKAAPGPIQELANKTLGSTKGLVISPKKQNTHSQSIAIKHLLTRGSERKIAAVQGKNISYLGGFEPKSETIGQKVTEILGEKLSKELVRDQHTGNQIGIGFLDERGKSSDDGTPAFKQLAILNKTLELAADPLIPEAASLNAPNEKQGNPIVLGTDLSFGGIGNPGSFGQIASDTRLLSDRSEAWKSVSPLSEAEVSNLANHNTNFYALSCKFSHLTVTNEQLLYSLHKHVPNMLQNVPSSRHETAELRSWHFRQLQAASSPEERESVCRLTVIECLRQFYVAFGQRALLMMVALQDLLGSYESRYSATKKQLDDHQKYFYETLGSRAASFDQEVTQQQALNAQLQEQLASMSTELESAKERLAEKQLIVLKYSFTNHRLIAQKDHFQASGQKMKAALVKYYGLVEDLKGMISTEKKWTPEDFEDNIRMFHSRKLNKKGKGKKPNLSLEDFERREDRDSQSENSDSESTDRQEFEAKRVKDAEQKIINEIFGGPV